MQNISCASDEKKDNTVFVTLRILQSPPADIGSVFHEL